MSASIKNRNTKRRRRCAIPQSYVDYAPGVCGGVGGYSSNPEEDPTTADPVPSLSLSSSAAAAASVSSTEGDGAAAAVDFPLLSVPPGPTFRPTAEEFGSDPLLYLEKIRPVAERYGICKIVPPEGWDPPFSLDVNNPHRLETKQQSIHRLQEGVSFDDGQEYTVKDYQRMASEWSKEWRERYYKQGEGEDREVAEDEGGEEKGSGKAAPGGKTAADGSVPGMGTPDGGGAPSTASTSSGSPGTDRNAEGKARRRRMTPQNLERDFWDIVESRAWEIDVDYGNDVDTAEFGSGFPLSERGRAVNSSNFQPEADGDESGDGDLSEPVFGSEEYYKETYWNLNNIPNSKNSILRHVKVGINGINVPWLYFGCLFSTFCWHTEDNYLYSINYHHKGAPKQWYGVPGTKKNADGVERVFKNYLSMKMRDVPDLMHHITTMFSPRLLKQEGVEDVCKLTQHAREFIVTFPRAFHGGFSLGPNVGEAVNFATHDWIHHGADANERYRSFARPSVFSHDRLIYTIAHHISGLQTASVCDSLARELRRMAQEELLLRRKLVESGVRDVSDQVELPPNRLDRLDELSADYDDKRLCHACKHICFFSAVACECSEQKVSCLRHSHYMCRCSISRRYLLIWTTEDEMTDAINKVEKRYEVLEGAGKAGGDELTGAKVESKELSSLPDGVVTLEGAPGSEGDRDSQRNYEVSVDPICPIDAIVPSRISSDSSVPSEPKFQGASNWGKTEHELENSERKQAKPANVNVNSESIMLMETSLRCQ